MGYRISWLAAEGADKATLLDHFGLVSTGEPDEANEVAFSVAELPTGWTVLWSNDPTFASVERCQPLSKLAPVLSCWVNETVMFSSANYFENGNFLWFVGHNAQEGLRNLESDGSLPAQLDDIKARLLAEQDAEDADSAEVDFVFDIPLELAQSVCGFKHDQSEFDWGTPQFVGAERSAPIDVRSNPAKKSWFARLIGS